jgi:hypothetical protein
MFDTQETPARPRPALFARPAASSSGRRWVLAGALRWITAVLVLGSAAIHFAVVPEHLAEYVPFGLFFVTAGLAQLALAAAILVAPRREVLLAGAAGTVAIIALWAVSRTVGVPVGPAPWEPEMPAVADVLCATLEAVTALLLIKLASGSEGDRR